MTILLCLLSLLLVQQPAHAELGTISGQLHDSRGTPVPGFRVFAMPVDVDGTADTLSSIAQADNQGRYRLDDVPPGRYLIAAGSLTTPSYYPGVTTRSQGQILTIAAGQAIANMDIAIAFLNSPPQLWGRVKFDDGSPLPVGTLQGIQLILSSDSVHWTTKPFTNQQGFFFFQPAPGEYSVTLAPLPLSYGYLKSLTFGNVDLTKAPIILTEDLNTTEIQVVLTKTRPPDIPPGVRLSGHISNRVPLVLNAVTTVIDQVHPGDVTNAVAYVTPTENGLFDIEGVPPGRYTLGPRDGKKSITLNVAGNDVTQLELDSTLVTSQSNPRTTKLPVSLSSSSIRSITGTVEVGNGTIPHFQLVFSTKRADQAPHTAEVSGKTFTITLPEGEYRVDVSGLPKGYIVESVTTGPLDLTFPFLVTAKGIADRFTGTPMLIRTAGTTAAISAGITVRLKAPTSEK